MTELRAVSMLPKNNPEKHHLLYKSKLSVTPSELGLTERDYQIPANGRRCFLSKIFVNPIFRGAWQQFTGVALVAGLNPTSHDTS